MSQEHEAPRDPYDDDEVGYEEFCQALDYAYATLGAGERLWNDGDEEWSIHIIDGEAVTLCSDGGDQ